MIQNYNYIVIDDEPKAIQLLTEAIKERYNNLYLTGSYTTWDTALQALEKNDTDLIFLDISIPHTNGMMLLEMVPQLSAEIIFVTAHEEHALKAFKYTPTGYLLKPIAPDMLMTTIDKALERINDKKQSELHGVEKILRQNNKIAIPDRSGYKYYDIDRIILLEANGSYTKIYFTDTQALTISKGLRTFEAILKDKGFLRVHKSYIINITYIQELRKEDGGYLLMSNDASVPISSRNREGILNKLKYFTPHL